MLIQTAKTRSRIAKARTARDNNNEALIPEFWANESLAILEENMVLGKLVRRDFNSLVAKMGSTVHVTRPGTYTAKRKTNTDNVTVQDATSTDVHVVLNQWLHTSFLIRDGEESQSRKSLVEQHIQPAMLANAQFVDRCLYGRAGQFFGNAAGKLGGLASATAKNYILNTRKVLNNNLCPMEGRNFILTPNAEMSVLDLDFFLGSNTKGDAGEALRTAMIGQMLGFDFYMSQNAATVDAGPVTVTGVINNGLLAVGTTTFTVNGFSAAIPVNSWVTIAGDMTPFRVVSTTGGATPTVIVVDRPSRYAVAHAAVVTVYSAAVTAATTYAVGYTKEIAVTFSPNTNLQVGQPVTFGIVTPSDPTINPVYSIVAVTSTTITLDRPLEVALLASTNVNGGPVGEYNFAFRRDALALVSRPLALPMSNLAMGAVATYNDLAMRACITYDGNKQGHLVTLDLLFGTALLDDDQGAIMLG